MDQAALEESLQRLREGNRRYVDNRLSADWSARRRGETAGDQKPFAMILGCVDSRVPPELVFDQGLGDLLVIRTAGQVIDRAVMGSLEFGVTGLQIPLLIILGHKRCGAVLAAMDALDRGREVTGSLAYLVESLAPAVAQVRRAEGDLWEQAGRANVALQVEQIKHLPVLGAAVESGRLAVTGGYYDLDTGIVEMIQSHRQG